MSSLLNHKKDHGGGKDGGADKNDNFDNQVVGQMIPAEQPMSAHAQRVWVLCGGGGLRR